MPTRGSDDNEVERPALSLTPVFFPVSMMDLPSTPAHDSF